MLPAPIKVIEVDLLGEKIGKIFKEEFSKSFVKLWGSAILVSSVVLP